MIGRHFFKFSFLYILLFFPFHRLLDSCNQCRFLSFKSDVFFWLHQLMSVFICSIPKTCIQIITSFPETHTLPYFCPGLDNVAHDIALVKLPRMAILNEGVQLVFLPLGRCHIHFTFLHFLSSQWAETTVFLMLCRLSPDCQLYWGLRPARGYGGETVSRNPLCHLLASRLC